MTNLVRLTVNLTERSDAALALAHQETSDSRTAIINRAVQVYAYLVHIAERSGTARVIHIADPSKPGTKPVQLVL